MRVLIATDTVHPDLSAAQVGEALAQGWRSAAPDVEVAVVPLAAGGGAALDVLADARPGRDEVLTVRGPDDVRRPVRVRVVGDPDAPSSVWADPADAVGTLAELGARAAHEAGPAEFLAEPELSPSARGATGSAEDVPSALDALTRAAVTSSSAGAGDLLGSLVGRGRVVLTLGDLTAHDAGAGALAELGRASGELDELLRGGGAGLGRVGPQHDDALRRVLDRAREELSGTDVVVAARTDEPLFGLHGANANLSRATGVDAMSAQELERAHGAFLARVDALTPARRELPRVTGSGGGARRRSGTTPGSGCGGGLGALLEALGARVLPAADVVAGDVGLASALEGADLVVTAVEVLDGGVLAFSVPATVGEAAVARALPVIALAREVRSSARELAPLGVAAAYPVTDQRRGHLPPERSGQEMREDLVERGRRLARTWTPPRP